MKNMIFHRLKSRLYNFTLLLYLLCSCSRIQKLNHYESKYNIHIEYEDCHNTEYDKRFEKDYLHLYVEDGFKNDVLEIKVNDELYFNDSISNSELLGLSEYFRLGKKEIIKTISIRLNNGKALITEYNIYDCSILKLNLIDSTLILKFSNKLSMYR